LDATGQKNLEFTKEYFSSKDSRGLELVANEQFAPADVSVAAQAAKLRAAKPDSIMIWAAGAPFGTALRDIANAGINVTIATSPLNANPDQLAQYASFLPKDLVLQGVPYQGKSMSPALAAAAKEYLDALKDAGLTPAALFPYSWDPAKLIVTALRALPQNPSGPQLRAYLATMHGVAGVFGTYDFRRGDQHGLSGSDFPFIRYDAEHRTWTPFDSGPSK
jgi:ABC-type branched-subunit amino acid transport system substrate-binding protein